MLFEKVIVLFEQAYSRVIHVHFVKDGFGALWLVIVKKISCVPWQGDGLEGLMQCTNVARFEFGTEK